ncbi:NAD dependent epimerase/dehydratase [Colletotrichum abscissum]|uniref:NAD dependent epimerase/dehydratase n=2 Tax=Colletotrichum acutatum species complex TaxID=2707335 RepID=A0AAI9YWN5_9PEZI|nr:NAD dependent epimerase/dehydratase [Colletotrichum costaricense]XP_060381823.1 NAD dependent epimerase/dehydratase [Colletotrichum tamarilloi]XP_060405523.1 NAD dependent epimerase/dehydratase [Colletotrichum abscissum]KAI3539355.1 NAD dependent epimerase/dehydratase [Colletotrichum filicis]KAK1498206.1 NAD dependent epimerase/dehydratase [Colletotrichum tamarilloi]KAK1523360.1 NAD dependent epimerase/dehydratase [Colletotrichum abscissum]KAK1527225.1 NAD dependent epimerase/dehydratase [
MTPERKFAIPKGSMVLVTGANGFIGSHVCNELLQLGFNVRGTVRDVTKCAWLPEALKRQRPKGDFMLVSLPDMEKEGAFDAAVEGVSAVIHAASPVSFSPNPESVIPRSITVALNALKAANKAASVKRFIFTSSSVAAALPQPEKKGIEVNSDSWNTESVEIAWREAPYHPQRAWHIYAASKVEAEMAVWKFYHENIRRRYDLIVSSVLPGTNFGRALDAANQGHSSTSSFIESLWNGTHVDRLASIPPQYFVDVEDNARLHVAAAVLPNVRSERIFAWAEPFNFDTVLDILRTHFPEKTFVDNFHHYRELSVVSQPQSRAVELLRQLGREGFVPLKQSVLLNVEDLS